MDAIVFDAANSVRFTQVPDPVAGPGDVVVQVIASGICHTDYEVLKANYGSSAFPVVPGHEYAGVVVEVGTEVDTVKTGDRVVVDPNIECGTCRACKRGWAHLCENLAAYGVTLDGGFAEYSAVSASAVHPIGDMPFSDAALAEPLGCVLNGVESVYTDWMKEALIFGAGPMGLLMAMTLKSRGVDTTLCDISDSRIELAHGLGFNALKSGSTELESWHHRADLAVDATGVPSVAGALTHYMANGSKGLFFGVCPSDATVAISPFEVFRRQLTLAGTHSLNHNIPAALETITNIGPEISKVVSHALPLEEIAGILASSLPDGSLKVQALNN